MKPAHVLLQIINTVAPELEKISQNDASGRPEGKWSKIEILGHLIDSALNNIGRIIRAQESPELMIEKYTQEHWVIAQGYQQANWGDILDLFYTLNRQIARTIALTPQEILDLPRPQHNLTPPYYTELPESGIPTLLFLIEDYICHMEHHLRQILSGYEPRMLDF